LIDMKYTKTGEGYVIKLERGEEAIGLKLLDL
jgi:hypothetical protein